MLGDIVYYRQIKSDKQILKETRINKFRKLNGKKPIKFSPNFIREVENPHIHSLYE